MRLRNYSHKTIKSYLNCLRAFVSYFQPKHPRSLNESDIRNYMLHLIEKKHVAAGTANIVFNALRLLYVDIYKIPFAIGTLPQR